MSNSTHSAYLNDLGILLKEKALEAKRSKEESVGTSNYEFCLGRLMAFHEIVSLMQQQAEAFGLELDEIGLEGINPEKSLL